jgi:exodeoxyribonuclease I
MARYTMRTMADSFFFYDLETSGFDPRSARVMQFAGQRTDSKLNPIGEPVNVLIKLTADVLPSPDAILITGITPQQTLAEGVTEAEFLKYFYDEVVQPNTTFLGFNSIRFDDEFMRFLHYRNFYDAYEWQWKDGCSRWDILDVVRMTRALRPDGIEWPFAPDGKPTNRLELLTSVNKLEHTKAHDALSDVHATIAIARLIQEKQPDLFKYLFSARQKKVARDLVLKGAPFVYTSGKYGSEFLHTTAATLLTKHEAQDAALVYDLRFDPTPYLKMSVDELVEVWKYSKEPMVPPRLPVKTLKYNRCPAVAPLGVMKDTAVQERIQLPLDIVTKHFEILQKHRVEFAEKILLAVRQLDAVRSKTQPELLENELTADERLYESFIGAEDTSLMRAIRVAQPEDLTKLADRLKDDRLRSLLPLYKARNFPKSLSAEERAAWDAFCSRKLLTGDTESQLAKYFARLQEIAARDSLTGEQQFLLEELQLYGESMMPDDAAG